MHHLLDRLPERTAKGRWDIQGLRAFAVVAVVIDHLTHWPGGGFIGVDVFFVISGFLITGLLLNEHEKNDWISFADFYRRRVRRIMPAAVLVLVATVAASYLTLNAARADSIRTDSIWALLFAANWRFLSTSTDYFNADGPVSPLQHFWSLSIEEQFYFVWPLLMLGVLTALLRGNRSRSSARVAVFASMATISVLSFAWALYATSNNATAAYFSTFTRVWELGVGAMLAVAVPVLRRIRPSVRPAMSWVGLAGLLASLWMVSGDAGFPAPGAALPVLATALIVAAGTYPDRMEQQRYLAPLTNPVAGYIGDISYSLYLWHFPIIVIGLATFGDTTPNRWVIVGVIAAVSVLSYELVENPIRESGWLLPLNQDVPGSTWRSRANRRRRWRKQKANFDLMTPRFTRFLGAGMALAAVALWAGAFNASNQEPPASALDSKEAQSAVEDAQESPGLAPSIRQAQRQLVVALESTSWPDLLPGVEESIGAAQAPSDVAPCGTFPLVDRADCTWGTGAKSIVVLGDSVGMTWVNPIRVAFGSSHQVSSYATFGCPFTATVISNPDPAITETCAARNADAVAAVNEVRPDLVVISNAYVGKAAADTEEVLSADDYVASTARLVEQFPLSTQVVFLAAPPGDADIAGCYTKSSSPADCTGQVTDDWEMWAQADRHAADVLGARWIDSTPLFCVGGLCPPYAGAAVTKSDHNHMTIEYGEQLSSALRATFRAEPAGA